MDRLNFFNKLIELKWNIEDLARLIVIFKYWIFYEINNFHNVHPSGVPIMKLHVLVTAYIFP